MKKFDSLRCLLCSVPLHGSTTTCLSIPIDVHFESVQRVTFTNNTATNLQYVHIGIRILEHVRGTSKNGIVGSKELVHI